MIDLNVNYAVFSFFCIANDISVTLVYHRRFRDSGSTRVTRHRKKVEYLSGTG